MFIRHLSYFVALARERHFARAAEVCNIAQPTLSAAIRKLEEDLDMPLVRRGHSFLGLTPEGERVLAWAQQILLDYDGLKTDLKRLRGGLTGTLRLGVIPAALPMVAKLTRPFVDAHPQASVAIHSMTSQAIQRALDSFELDAGLTYLDNEPLTHARTLKLFRERYVFLTADRSLGCDGAIAWARASAQSLCLLGADMQHRRVLDRVAESIGLLLRPSVTSNSFLALVAHVKTGGWSTIMPETMVELIGGAPDLCALRLIEPAHEQTLGLVFSDRDPLPAMTSALIAATATPESAAVDMGEDA
jgi:DNA-binding transcriptional LysR family regulator